jgi:hypothetical protein
VDHRDHARMMKEPPRKVGPEHEYGKCRRETHVCETEIQKRNAGGRKECPPIRGALAHAIYEDSIVDGG